MYVDSGNQIGYSQDYTHKEKENQDDRYIDTEHVDNTEETRMYVLWFDE